MSNVWSGGLGTLLFLSLPWIAYAQSSNEDAKKRHIGCAAVLGAASTVATDKTLQNKFASGSMLLLSWASEPAAGQSAKAKTDQVTREFAPQVIEIGRAIKAGTPSAAKEFDAKYGSALKSCESWLAAEIKKRKGS